MGGSERKTGFVVAGSSTAVVDEWDAVGVVDMVGSVDPVRGQLHPNYTLLEAAEGIAGRTAVGNLAHTLPPVARCTVAGLLDTAGQVVDTVKDQAGRDKVYGRVPSVEH